MPKRNVNTTRRTTKAATVATEQPATLGELLATTEQPATEQPATDTTEQPIIEQPATTTEQPATTEQPEQPATEQPATVAAPAKPDPKAEFNERRSAALLSSVELYNGPSLAVHRSDKQPAGAEYLSRVAKPVQIAKTISPRDDASLLACYDHLTTYHGADYSAGFNPDRFGADLGAISRNASLNRLTLTECGNHVMLTPLGLTNARNLVATRDKRNSKA